MPQGGREGRAQVVGYRFYQPIAVSNLTQLGSVLGGHVLHQTRRTPKGAGRGAHRCDVASDKANPLARWGNDRNVVANHFTSERSQQRKVSNL